MRSSSQQCQCYQLKTRKYDFCCAYIEMFFRNWRTLLSDSVGWPDPEFSGTGVQCSCNIHWADQEAMKGNILFTSKHVANNCSLRYGCNILTDACSHTISFINTARMIIAHSLSNQNMAFAFMIERLLWHCARVKSVFATPGVILLGGHSISIFFLYKMVK